MSRKDLFNAVQRKYLKTENSLSPMGESEQNAPIFNRIQSKYLSGLDEPSDRTAEDGAFNVLPPLSFRTGAHTGEESPGLGGGDRTTGSLVSLGMTGEGCPGHDAIGSRFKNAPAVPALLSFRTSPQTGEKSRGRASADQAAGSLRGSLAALGMTGESLPEPDTLVFRALK